MPTPHFGGGIAYRGPLARESVKLSSRLCRSVKNSDAGLSESAQGLPFPPLHGHATRSGVSLLR